MYKLLVFILVFIVTKIKAKDLFVTTQTYYDPCHEFDKARDCLSADLSDEGLICVWFAYDEDDCGHCYTEDDTCEVVSENTRAYYDSKTAYCLIDDVPTWQVDSCYSEDNVTCVSVNCKTELNSCGSDTTDCHSLFDSVVQDYNDWADSCNATLGDDRRRMIKNEQGKLIDFSLRKYLKTQKRRRMQLGRRRLEEDETDDGDFCDRVTNWDELSDDCQNSYEKCFDRLLDRCHTDRDTYETECEALVGIRKCEARECERHDGADDCDAHCGDEFIDCVFEDRCYRAITDMDEEFGFDDENNDEDDFWQIFDIITWANETYCVDTDTEDYCSPQFWRTLRCAENKCIRKECPYDRCYDEMLDCYNDDVCNEELLNATSYIDETYRASANIHVLIIKRMCENGNDIFTCSDTLMQLLDCMLGEDGCRDWTGDDHGKDDCFETVCFDEIESCFDINECVDIVLEVLEYDRICDEDDDTGESQYNETKCTRYQRDNPYADSYLQYACWNAHKGDCNGIIEAMTCQMAECEIPECHEEADGDDSSDTVVVEESSFELGCLDCMDTCWSYFWTCYLDRDCYIAIMAEGALDNAFEAVFKALNGTQGWIAPSDWSGYLEEYYCNNDDYHVICNETAWNLWNCMFENCLYDLLYPDCIWQECRTPADKCFKGEMGQCETEVFECFINDNGNDDSDGDGDDDSETDENTENRSDAQQRKDECCEDGCSSDFEDLFDCYIGKCTYDDSDSNDDSTGFMMSFSFNLICTLTWILVAFFT